MLSSMVYARYNELLAQAKTSILAQSRHAAQAPHPLGVCFRQGLAADGSDSRERPGRERTEM
jgi:hypothetical protein